MSIDFTTNPQESNHKEVIFEHLTSLQAKAIEKLERGNQSVAMALFLENLMAIDEALKTLPNDVDFHILKGYTLKYIFQCSENLLSNEERQAYLCRAHESFNRSLELDPKNASAHNGLGNVFFFQGYYDEAKKETEKAIKLVDGYYPAANHDLYLILKIIQEKAKSTYQQSKGTPTEELACKINHEVQKWQISDQEQMKRNVHHLLFSLKAKISNNPTNKDVYDKIEGINKEKDLVRQYELLAELLPILIASIPQIVIGGNMTGDIYSNVKIEGTGNVVGSNNIISINQQQLAQIPDEYAKSLQAFSDAVNAQLKKHNISQEKAAPVQESINELVKEVDIKSEEKIDIEKKEDIKSKLTKVAIRLSKILPEEAETSATFSPLAPFSKIIDKELVIVLRNVSADFNPRPDAISSKESVPVLLGVSAPKVVKPGDSFTARFVAYIKSLEETVKKELSELSRGRSESYMGVESCRWKLETNVTVKLSGKHLKVNPSESKFVWKGERNLLNFLVDVHADAIEEWTVLQYEVFIDGIRVAFIPLDLEITSRTKSDKRNMATIEPAHTAFASYASQDRMRVLDRVAAVRISAGLDIFMDCLSIHPGEEWKKRLESEIEKRELFLLFWSANAKNSEWVAWEWKTALVKKGESALQLHPLQTVTEAPPPEELKKFHFGDVYMIVRDAQEKKG